MDWMKNTPTSRKINIERTIRATSGLVRYDAKNEALDWPQVAKEALSNEKPDAIGVMLSERPVAATREGCGAAKAKW